MRFRKLLAVAGIWLLAGCAGGTTVTIGTDAGQDGAADGVAEVDLAPADTGGQEAGVDRAAPDVPQEATDLAAESVDQAADLEPGCDPGSGCFGEPCLEGAQCASGWCVELAGDGVCTSGCQDGCPDGWECVPADPLSPDGEIVCASRFAALCKPCVDSQGCQSGAMANGVCIVYADQGTFCASPCTQDLDCPEGFACGSAAGPDGVEASVCVAVSGSCPCTPLSVARGLESLCWVSNDAGTCQGQQACADGGMAACDAATPAQEVCDGVDNDCNGEVDGPAEQLCDDDNPCTQDSCQGADGCAYTALGEGACDDLDACTQGDSCQEGVCKGAPAVCDDGNACTDDACTASGECAATPNTVTCDDGDPCTVADACGQGECKGVAVDCDCQADADCDVLDDGDLCTGVLYCNTSKLPHVCAVLGGSVPKCPEPAAGPDAICAQAACMPETGECLIVADHEGFACEDGDACTIGDTCTGGLCAAGSDMGCNDGNPCTDDTCDPGLGCVHTNNALACDDGDVCTTKDTCAAGACVGGLPLICDDGNFCNGFELCVPGTGCQPGQILECDDKNPCDGLETCDPDVGCVAGAPLQCADANPCTDDACDPASGCVFKPNTASCNDGNACTVVDVCGNGVCKGSGAPNCDDGNPCTQDACVAPGGCVHSSAAGPCSDGNACTVGDTCDDGECIGGAPMDCDDGNGCTDDACLAGKCQHAANALPCDDGNKCTVLDECSGGACKGSGAPDCDDDNPCTKDVCVPPAGCSHAPAAGPCDDGNPCTTGDYCDSGSCVAGQGVACDDGNVCTDDACVGGKCVHSPNTAVCDDDNKCTAVDLCVNGKCKGTKPVACADGDICTDDACDPDLGCLHTYNQAPCNDKDVCTAGDRCELGLCMPGEDIDCDDGNVCTDDSCDSATGCVHAFNDGPCEDGDACTEDDYCEFGECLPGSGVTCDDGNVCTDDSCDPAVGCVFTDNSAGCDDGNACTQDDTCGGGECLPGKDVVCSDANACTTDSCEPASGCVYTIVPLCCGNGIVEAGEECDTGSANGTGGCSIDCKIVAPINVTFTHCGQTGPLGPSQTQCNSAYAGNFWLNGKVTVTGGIQYWTVPLTATYRVEAYGARGGRSGGLGARMRGDFVLTQGTVLKIIVGQQGLQAPANVGSGGGGGSYVAKSDNTPLLVAGGGSGTGHDGAYSGNSNLNGRIETSGAAGLCGNAGAGGTNGNGGGYATTTGNGTPNAAGGAGFYGNGGTSGAAKGGFSFVNGGNGGNSTGGFGGGGGSDLFIYGCGSSPHGGSGGGGYSGGGGGGDNCNCGGGGGGSYNTGNNQSNSAGVNSGHGSVSILRL